MAPLQTEPSPELLSIYGTTKEADATVLAARIATAVLGLGLLNADREHVKDHKEQAEQLNDIARYQESRRMDATINAMKMAEASGAAMARAGLEKQAFGAFVGKAIGAAAGTAAKGAGKLTPGWKSKALVGGGTLAAGVGGYKGMSKARDYANTDQGNAQWGSKRPVNHNVSAWGYPTP